MAGRARAEARRTDNTTFSPLSLLGQSLTNVVQEKHLDALVVYEDPPGAWYADLVLKGLPTGMPSVMGTPVAEPKASRAEALRDAYMILVAVLRAVFEREIGGHDTRHKDLRIFEIDGHSFSIPGKAIDEAKAEGDALGFSETFDEDDALAHFERVLSLVTGSETFEKKHFEAASEALRARLIAAMAMMLIFGHFRYPPRRQGSPREDGDA